MSDDPLFVIEDWETAKCLATTSGLRIERYSDEFHIHFLAPKSAPLYSTPNLEYVLAWLAGYVAPQPPPTQSESS